MRRILVLALAAAIALTCVPAFARNASPGHPAAQVTDPNFGLGPPAPMPPMENRIPAPLGPAAQAPVVNGPISQPALRGLNGIGQQ
jgi:hypothetical protein